MTHTKKNEAGTVVTWRLPRDMVQALGPDGVRSMIAAWVRSDSPLRARSTDELVHRCYSIPPDMVQALEHEAARLAEETGERWSAARVVREIWAQRALGR